MPVARRNEHVERTRRALLRAARHVFAARGYADASLDDIVARARVTKGALYHHWENKAALLEAVYVEMEEELAADVRAAIAEAPASARARLEAALAAFFAASSEPAYVRVVLREAPLVLGHLRGRELDHQIGLALVVELIGGLVEAGEVRPLPIEPTARMLFAAASEVAIAMAYAADPAAALAEGMVVLLAILDGLHPARSL